MTDEVPDSTCWLCRNLGALRPFTYGDGEVAWIPFRATERIDLARGEHVCPACRGTHQPRRVFFAHQQPKPDEPQ